MQPPDSNTGDFFNPVPQRPITPQSPLEPPEGFSEAVHPDDAGHEFTSAMHQAAQDDADRDAVLEDIMARIYRGEPVSLVFAKPEDLPTLSAFKLCVKDGQLAIDDY